VDEFTGGQVEWVRGEGAKGDTVSEIVCLLGFVPEN